MFFYLRRNLKLIFLLSIINLNFLLIKNSFCADIENLGSISSDRSHSGVINNSNNITNLTNKGSVNATGNFGYGIYTSANITNLTNNSGTISTSGRFGKGIYNYQSTITNLTNNIGTISTSGNYGNGIYNRGTITNLANSATISTSGSYGVGIYNHDRFTTTTLTNSGTISASGLYGNGIYNGVGATTTTLTNSGTVLTSNSYSDGIYNDGTITNLTNSGTISTPVNYGKGIRNIGTITTLNNSQGSGNNAGALTYRGNLPTNYNIIINSTSVYGRLSATSVTGTMTFGIYSGSTVSAGATYDNVLAGVSSLNLSSLLGTSQNCNWSLQMDAQSNYDLVISTCSTPPSSAPPSSRQTYNQTVTNSKLTTTASKFENMRTIGKNSVLTTKLDALSAAQLEEYLRKSQGLTKVKSNTQAIQSQSNFKTALSTITAPKSFSPAGRGPSPITNLTRTNVGNLTLADLKTNELYASIQPANFSSDDKLFNQASNQSGTNVLEFLKSNKNRDLISNDLKESGFFLRTFGSITNYAAINSDDNSYNNDSYGFFGGVQHKIDENLYQGYSLGFSTNKLTLDASEGNTKTNTIHADIYRKIEEKEYGATISLGTYVSFIDNVRNISETSEILKSSPINSGIDLKLELVKSLNLFGLNFYPSVSITGSYGLVENYKEKGGSGSALEVKAHNVLATKPEIGFRFENNFVETEKMTEGLNFSLFASRQKYHDGHTSTSSLIGENDFTGSTLPKIKDDFLTAGLGYAAKNIDEKSDLNFNFFYTQSTNNALNSSLLSISYNRVF